MEIEMKMHQIISLIILSVGFSQQLPKVVETYENGNIRIINYHKETQRGMEKVKYEAYHYTGQKASEGTYLNGKEDGLWTYWYENGQKRWEGTVKNGKRNGLWTYWHENGQKEKEYTYKDGELDGKATFWYENGQKSSEGNFKGKNKHGGAKKNGIWTRWHENGQKEKEETYKDGELDGLWTRWHENGQKEWEETYKDGELDGLYTLWDENGSLKFKLTLQDGKMSDTETNNFKFAIQNGVKINSSLIKVFKSVFVIDGRFNCFDGSKSTLGNYVNDGDCDCSDCSDEPLLTR